MIVKIERLAHNFKGIGKIDGKIILVNNALPGEIVDVKVVKEKKKYAEAEIISFLKKSTRRISPKCPYASKCGGCDISYIDYIMSLQYKKDMVVDIIKRYADIDVNPSIISDGNVYKYRNKITLQVLNGKLALIEEKSHRLINIDYCLLANNNINNVIIEINNMDLSGVQNVIIKGNEELMVIINGCIDEKKLVAILSNHVSSVIVNNKVIYGKEYITIKVNTYKYALFPFSFFQINTNMIKSLYDRILKYAGKGQFLLDLYCGAGTIGIYLASNFELVKGIELNQDAIRSANLNKKINNIDNIVFECKSVNDINKITEDVVIVDPPRNGLDPSITDKLLKSLAKKIIYVSCKPITLARDLNVLKEKYILQDIILFDMFPNTKHVECVSVLSRKAQ